MKENRIGKILQYSWHFMPSLIKKTLLRTKIVMLNEQNKFHINHRKIVMKYLEILLLIIHFCFNLSKYSLDDFALENAFEIVAFIRVLISPLSAPGFDKN